jgi:hypothetical protein
MFVVLALLREEEPIILGVFSTKEKAIAAGKKAWADDQWDYDAVEVYAFTVDKPLASYQQPVWEGASQ